MKIFRLFFVLIGVFICCILSGQTSMLDSLNNTWIEIQDDSLRIANKKAVAWFLHQNYQNEESKLLALSTLEEARNAGLIALEKEVLVQLTFITYNLIQLDSFNSFWEEAYTSCQQLQDTLGLYDLLNIKASQLVNELKYDSAYTVYHTTLDLLQDDSYIYQRLNIYNNLAIVFGEQGLIEKAKHYFNRATLTGLSIHDSAAVYLGYSNMARCFIELEQADSAGIYLAKAVPWISKANERSNGAYFFLLKGWVAKLQQNNEQALLFFRQSLQLSDEIGDRRLVYAEIGYIHSTLSNYDSAIHYLEKAETLSLKARDNIVLRDVLPALANSYAAQDDYSKGYEYASRAIDFRDKYLVDEVQRQVAEMEAKYQIENLESDNRSLKIIADQQKVKARQRTLFAAVGFIALLFISTLLFKLWKQNKMIYALNEDLEKKVEKRTEELEVANDKLKDILEDLRMFTYVASHDLKEPLRNISGFSSLLERRMEGELKNDDAKTFLQLIRSNANQMHSLIEGIQFYANIEAKGAKNEAMEDISLGGIFKLVKANLATMIAEKKAEVIIHDELPVVYSSPSILQVILKNLIENGIKYNRSGSPLIQIRCRREGKYYDIQFKDNGIGISPRFQSQIFEMFKRLHTREEYSGTGMGLAISLRLANRLQGDILLESEEGKGSTFTLRLPKEME